MKLIIIKILLLLAENVFGIGQCWYCSQVLHPKICAEALFIDGYCTWKNNRCVPKSVQPWPTQLELLVQSQNQTRYECSQKSSSSCQGLDVKRNDTLCTLNFQTKRCTGLTISPQGCSAYKAEWQCFAVISIQGCMWIKGKCRQDTCIGRSKNSCTYKYGPNLQLWPCVFKQAKCSDGKVSELTPQVCAFLSSFWGTCAQLDSQNRCRECVGTYPPLMRLYIPVTRRRILSKRLF